MKKLIVLVMILAATACGGGGGGGGSTPPADTPTAPTPPPTGSVPSHEDLGGVWRGESSSDNQRFPDQDIVGVTTDDGRMRFISLDTLFQYYGRASISGDQLTLSGMVSTNQQDPVAFTFDGQISERAQIIGLWNIPSIPDSGRLTVSYDHELHNRVVNPEAVAGNWMSFDVRTGNPDANVTLYANGTITAIDTFGCSFNGTYARVNPVYNTYNLSVTVTDCDNVDGTYVGLGVFLDTVKQNGSINRNGMFVYSVDNGVYFKTSVIYDSRTLQ